MNPVSPLDYFDPRSEYLQDAAEIVQALNARFGLSLTLPTPQALKAWLQTSVPTTILNQVIQGGSLWNCSGISPWWASLSVWNGLPVVVQPGQGHVWNVALTTEGPVRVDLLAIGQQMRRYASEKEGLRALLPIVMANPFASISVEWKKNVGGYVLPSAQQDDFFNPQRSYAFTAQEEAFVLEDARGRHYADIATWRAAEDASVLDVLEER